jgi:hypothetical protein
LSGLRGLFAAQALPAFARDGNGSIGEKLGRRDPIGYKTPSR